MNHTTNNRRRGKRRWLVRLAFFFLGLLGTTVIVSGCTYMFGGVGGEEFCPDTFERRSFHYYQIPWLRVQVTPIWRDDMTNSLEKSLRSQKLIPPRSPEKPRWDLVRSWRSTSGIAHGDASILCRYLDARDEEDDLYWEKWTKDHPKRAKVLWPAVARVARQQLYMFTPEAIDLAKSAGEDTPLSTQLETLLVQQYRRLALAQQEIGAHETAVELLDEAILYAPDEQELARFRDESLKHIESPVAPQ